MFKKRRPPSGSRPGTLAIPHDAPPPKIRVKRYTPDTLEATDIESVDELGPIMEQPGVKWIDIQGLGDEKVLRALSTRFDVHPLALEDVVHVPTRPKCEEYTSHLLFISRMAMQEPEGALSIEQVSIFIGADYVLTFQEEYGDVLDPVRERIRKGKGPLRSAGAAYLGYAIIDTIIDNYFPVMEEYGSMLEGLEDEVIAEPSSEMLGRINNVRRDLITLRRGVWPQRDAINSMLRDRSDFLDDATFVYMRDAYDHLVQLTDIVETYREMSGSLLNTYLSAIANKTNDVMKVLTIMASIFIPLTFMAGIYGMNFENMPELHFRWGYPILLAAMTVTGVGMVAYFVRKGWIGK